MPLKRKYDDLPLPYLDGWHAHRTSQIRQRNPFNAALQYASHETWTEGWLARKYDILNKIDTTDMDEYVPRFSV